MRPFVTLFLAFLSLIIFRLVSVVTFAAAQCLILWLLSLNWMVFNMGQTSWLPGVLQWPATPYNWPPSGFFQTGFLASRLREYLSTYYHQSTFVHGLPLTGPGLPQGFFPNVLRKALDELIIDYYRSSPVAPAPDHFLLFTKGANKLELFEDALSNTPLLLTVEYRNLGSMNCPTVAQLAPEAAGRIVPTQFKATEYAIVFSFDILRDPEQRKLELFYTAFFVNFLNSVAWLTFNFELFSLTYDLLNWIYFFAVRLILFSLLSFCFVML